MNKSYLIIFVFLFLLAIVMFNTPDSPTGYIVSADNGFDYYINNLNETIDEYNKNIDNVPGFIKSIFGNEKINAELTLANGTTKEFQVITQRGKIITLEESSLDKPSLELNTKEEVIQNIINAENQVDALQKALDNKDIDYHAVKITTKTKTFFAKVVLKVFSWFR